MFSDDDDDRLNECEWIVDSGANTHVINDKAWFLDFTPIEYSVSTANKSSRLDVCGGGHVQLNLRSPDNTPLEIKLLNVAYCPSSRANILSLDLLCEKANLRGTWGKHGISLLTEDGFQILTIPRKNGLYSFFTKPSSNLATKGLMEEFPSEQKDMNESHAESLPSGIQPPFVTAVLNYSDPVWKWHQRMGHLGLSNLQKLVNSSTGMDLTVKDI